MAKKRIILLIVSITSAIIIGVSIAFTQLKKEDEANPRKMLPLKMWMYNEIPCHGEPTFVTKAEAHKHIHPDYRGWMPLEEDFIIKHINYTDKSPVEKIIPDYFHRGKFIVKKNSIWFLFDCKDDMTELWLIKAIGKKPNLGFEITPERFKELKDSFINEWEGS